MPSYRIFVMQEVADGELPNLAVVECATSIDHLSVKEIKEKISRAVAKWMDQTEIGDEYRSEFGDDFDALSLAQYHENIQLASLVEQEGIYGLEVHLHAALDVDPDWTFDDSLVLKEART